MSFDRLKDLPVLITGGAGFIGSHLTHALLNAGAKIRVLDDFSHGTAENLADISPRIEIIRGDIRSPQTCLDAAHGRAIIFHLAALGSVPRSVNEPLLYNEVNIAGTLNILEAARKSGVQRLVYSASSSAYGDTPILPKTESMPPNPMSPYAITKLVGEFYCRVYSSVYGLSTMALRYFNVFGPRQNPNSQYAAVIPAFITALLKGQRPRIYGDGNQTRDFCFVDNVVHANMLAAVSPKPLAGEIANIACGQRTSLNELLNLMQTQLKSTLTAEYLPAQPGDVRDSFADISAARKLLDYTPQVFFEEGLKHTISAYISNA